ncbi:LemA family protein [Nostoc sp.]|uniref:LemA family protein n=1 Tax=Nostoc sp. TaxID=1180 RepID=UPI002FFB6000
MSEVEEQLSAARRFYNYAVTEYNNAVEMVRLGFFDKNFKSQRRDKSPSLQ